MKAVYGLVHEADTRIGRGEIVVFLPSPLSEDVGSPYMGPHDEPLAFFDGPMASRDASRWCDAWNAGGRAKERLLRREGR